MLATSGGASSDVTVTFDSTGLANGTYNGTLCVDSNDPAAPQVRVPVTLNVGGPSITISQTVGTDSSACATTDVITVTTGSTVYYCYEVTNTGDITLLPFWNCTRAWKRW